jgi:hypothetical protein
VAGDTKKGTSRAAQEYESPLLPGSPPTLVFDDGSTTVVSGDEEPEK